MPPDVAHELAGATRAFHPMFYGLPGAAEAARAFAAGVARLEMIGGRALDVVEQQLRHADATTRNAAARILAGMRAPEAAARLIAAYLHHDRPQLVARYLARLGKSSPVPPSALPRLDQVRPFERSALVRALFRRPGPEAESMIEPIFGGFESVLAEAAIAGMATWGEPARLRAVMNGPPMSAPHLPRELQPLDVRPVAAFHLALLADDEALDRLRAWTRERRPLTAARAVQQLAYLAHVDGVERCATLLGGRRGEALDLALDAAEVYRTPMLAPALLALAERDGARRDRATGEPRSIEPLTALSWIVAATADQPPRADRLRAQADALVADHRYASGAPLTLAILATELWRLDEGPRAGAAHNLRAITGEDHGFDLDDDLAGNLDAIAAWTERARAPAPLAPGGWAFLGRPVAPPPAPRRPR